jgi:uncharacterized DUF497 family protein
MELKKHGISFEEASEPFKIPDNLILEVYDFEHSIDEGGKHDGQC